MTVNHKDGNRLNNNINNLEWLSRADNIRYGFQNGQYSTCKKCVLIKDNKKYIFISMSQAGKFLGRSNSYISKRLKYNTNVFDTKGNEYKILVA